MAMASASAAEKQDLAVQADLHFLVSAGEKPRNYTFDPPGGGPRSNAQYAPHRVTIHDARPSAANFTLDRAGVVLVEHASAVREFWDEDEISRVYYPESERLITELTGADRVLEFDHTLRRRVPGGDDRAG